MTTTIAFSRKNDAGSRVSNTQYFRESRTRSRTWKETRAPRAKKYM